MFPVNFSKADESRVNFKIIWKLFFSVGYFKYCFQKVSFIVV